MTEIPQPDWDAPEVRAALEVEQAFLRDKLGRDRLEEYNTLNQISADDAIAFLRKHLSEEDFGHCSDLSVEVIWAALPAYMKRRELRELQ